MVDDLRRDPLLVRHVVEHKPKPKPFGGRLVAQDRNGFEQRYFFTVQGGRRTQDFTVVDERGVLLPHRFYIEWDYDQ